MTSPSPAAPLIAAARREAWSLPEDASGRLAASLAPGRLSRRAGRPIPAGREKPSLPVPRGRNAGPPARPAGAGGLHPLPSTA